MRNRIMPGPWGAIVVALAACASAAAPHASAQPSATSSDATAAVRAAAQEYLAAMQRGDVGRLRMLWTPEGDYVDAAGNKYKAQDLLAKMGAAGVVAPGAGKSAGDAAAPISTLRFVGPNVAIEDGTTGPQAGDDGGAATGRFTAIWVNREGKWLLDGLREAAVAAPPGNPKLRPLDWLVGEWTGVSDDGVTLMSWHWNDGGAYLVGEFVMYQGGQPVAGGSQRVGWDPVAKQIKSWIFDSQGGSGEGNWRADGERWVVDSAHVTADGQRAKTSVSYLPGAGDSFVWEVAGDWQASTPATGDAKLPAQRIEFHRAAADK